MINKLLEFYDKTLSNGKLMDEKTGICSYGFTLVAVPVFLYFNKDGYVRCDFVDSKDDSECRHVVVPKFVHSNTISSCGLWDNSSYVLGVNNENSKKQNGSEKQKTFIETLMLYSNCHKGIQIVCNALLNQKEVIITELNNIAKYDSSTNINLIWIDENNNEENLCQCEQVTKLFLSQTTALDQICELRSPIKGFGSPNSKLSSSNGNKGFIKYGFTSGSEISNDEDFKIAEVLKYFLTDDKHHFYINGDKTIFWTKENNQHNLFLAKECFLPSFIPKQKEDETMAKAYEALFNNIKNINSTDSEYYVYQLKNNVSRISIVSKYEGNIFELVNRIKAYKECCSISIKHLIKLFELRNDNINAKFQKELIEYILCNTKFPIQLYQLALLDINGSVMGKHKENNKERYNNALRVFKLYLNNERNIMKENRAYKIGRVVAACEMLKSYSNELKGTIKPESILNMIPRTPTLLSRYLEKKQYHSQRVKSINIKNFVNDQLALLTSDDNLNLEIPFSDVETGYYWLGWECFMSDFWDRKRELEQPKNKEEVTT